MARLMPPPPGGGAWRLATTLDGVSLSLRPASAALVRVSFDLWPAEIGEKLSSPSEESDELSPVNGELLIWVARCR